MRSLGASGVWELFLPGVGDGDYYKFEIITADGHIRLKADPLAFAAEMPPGTASMVTARLTSGTTRNGSSSAVATTSSIADSRPMRSTWVRGGGCPKTGTAG